MRLFRLLKIASVASRFGLDEMVLEHEPSGRLVRIANALQFWRNLSAPRAERLRLALEHSHIDSGEGRTIRVTLSAGLAPLAGDAEHSLALADAALYQAKNSGRNRVVVADPN